MDLARSQDQASSIALGANAAVAARDRLVGLDMLKGTLLLFVIIGHFPNVPVESNYLKQVIYAFHMPVFIIVTGYLFNVEKWSAAPFASFLRHYIARLVVPWAVASAAYYTLKIFEGETIKAIIKYSIFQPWSLLWFIPAVCLMMAAAVIIARFSVRPIVTLIVSTLAVLALQIWFQRYGRDAGEAIQSLVVLGDRRYYLYFPFFAFGLFLRRHGTDMLTPAVALAIILGGGLIYLSGRVFDDPATFLFLNFMVGAGAIALARRATVHRSIEALAFLGRESLPIYLWHYFAIVVARHFASGPSFVLLASLGVATVVGTVYVLSRQNSAGLVRMIAFGR